MRPAVFLLALPLIGCAGTGPESTCYYDGDGDGYGSASAFEYAGPCSEHANGSDRGDDCDDGADWIHPEAEDELADGFDADCDGLDPWPCFVDADGDGFGDESAPMAYDACEADPGHSPFGEDCDDSDPAAYPFAEETADDGVDQDCDGEDAVTCWYDGDGDGFGAGEPVVVPESVCVPPRSPLGGGCLDASDALQDAASVYPAAPAICDGGVNDCGARAALDGEFSWSESLDWQRHFILDPDDGLLLPLGDLGSSWTVDLELREAIPLSERRLLWKADSDGELEFELVRQIFWELLLRVGPEPAAELTLAAPPLPEASSDVARHLALVASGGELSAWSGEDLLGTLDLGALDPTTPLVVGTSLDAAGEPEGGDVELRVGDLRAWDRALQRDELGWLMCRSLRLDEAADSADLKLLLGFEPVMEADGGGGEVRVGWSPTDASGAGVQPGFVGDPRLAHPDGELPLLLP